MYEISSTSVLKKASKIVCNYCLFVTIACYSLVVGMPLLKITNCSRERRFCVAAETVVKLLEKGKTIKFYSQVLLN